MDEERVIVEVLLYVELAKRFSATDVTALTVLVKDIYNSIRDDDIDVLVSNKHTTVSISEADH